MESKKPYFKLENVLLIVGIGTIFFGLFELRETTFGYFSNQSAFGMILAVQSCILRRQSK